MQYVLNADHTIEPMTDPVEWMRRYELDNRVIAVDQVGKSLVSTTFTGIAQGYDDSNHPYVFETVVMKGTLDGKTCRYSSYKAAQEGHKEVLQAVEDVEQGQPSSSSGDPA
jgi:hypothetical protein